MKSEQDEPSTKETNRSRAKVKVFANGARRRLTHGPIIIPDGSSVSVDFDNAHYAPVRGMGNKHTGQALKIAEVEINIGGGQSIIYSLPSSGSCTASVHCRVGNLTESVVVQGREPVAIDFTSGFALVTDSGPRKIFRHPHAKLEEIIISDASGTELFRLNLRRFTAEITVWDDHASEKG
jgi:hypothetical protein